MAKPAKKYNALISFITFFACALLTGFLIGKLLKGDSEPIDFQISKWVIVVSIIPIVFFVLGIHEAGHAIVGKKVGFDLISFVVGPLAIDKMEAGWKFHLNKNLQSYGGMVISLPVGDQNLGNRFMKYALGGPIASLLLAILCLLFFFILPGLRPMFILTGITSFLIFVVTIIPSKIGMFYSDGARFLRLYKGGKTADYEVGFLKIMANTLQGVRPRQLTGLQEALDLAIELKEPNEVYLYGLLHQFAWDNNDLEASETYLLKYLEGTKDAPPMVINSVLLDAAFFYAYAKKDLQVSQVYLEKFNMQPFIAKAEVLATEASITMLKGDLNGARQKALEAKEVLPAMLDKGLAVVLGEKIDHLLTTL